MTPTAARATRASCVHFGQREVTAASAKLHPSAMPAAATYQYRPVPGTAGRNPKGAMVTIAHSHPHDAGPLREALPVPHAGAATASAAIVHAATTATAGHGWV